MEREMSNKITREDLLLTANTLRGLAMDGVQKAESGHPGMPMGMADVAAVLFLKHLRYCPARPDWPDRDRFVLSGGHGCMLLYGLLHLAGYDLPMAELQAFRQWGSRTPGHPEADPGRGVETSTGPLAQGCGNAVGMALAERMLAERFNVGPHAPMDHHTFVFCGDGDLMEGLSHEAFSLAGHLGLHKLIVFYDSNRITIEGSTDLSCSDDVRRRFQGYRWNVLETDAHDFDAIDRVIRRALREKTRPTLIVCRSHIAHGSPNKHDTAAAHGEPLGEAEVKASKRNLGLPENELFHVPPAVRELFAARAVRLKRAAGRWDRLFREYSSANPDKAAEWRRFWEDTIPDDLPSRLPSFDPATPTATRVASGKVMQALAAAVPQLVGGAADLAPSTKTLLQNAGSVGPAAFAGRNLHFGVREHAMAAVLNGIALHGGLRPFGATFFVFLDYCRPSVRLAAMMKLPVIYVFTHDSFCVGEDGPTHQPVEHLATLRCIPNLTVIRPADAGETAAAWVAALRNRSGPTALVLSRQNLRVFDRARFPAADNLEKGAYVMWESGGDPDVLLIASGSELAVALDAAQQLAAECRVRVVNMPSWELFERQPAEYRARVLPPACRARVAVEAGRSMGWERYVGERGRIIALDRFGASGERRLGGPRHAPGLTPAATGGRTWPDSSFTGAGGFTAATARPATRTPRSPCWPPAC
jgi:transketolase